MIAPLELSRNAKIDFSKKAAAMTHMKPMIDENRIAFAGTPIERDPGTYKIRATAENADAVEQTVTLNAGDNKMKAEIGATQ